MKNYISLFIIIFFLPFILWNIIAILPTFDDFTTLQSPHFTPILSNNLLPNDSFWRPWDYLFGCLLGKYTWLFPTLNHICIILGHTLNTIIVFLLCRNFHFNNLSTHIATLFFFFSPANLGTTLAVDGLNQTYAVFWGLMALYVYLNNKNKYVLWPLFIFISVLSKENGLAWAIIPPILAFVFYHTDKKTVLKDIGIVFLIVFIYFFLRITLRTPGTDNDDIYLNNTIVDHIKDLIQVLSYTWFPVDYISIVYPPKRNWIIAVFTMLVIIPFIYLLVTKGLKLICQQKLLSLIACFFILISPHLITLVSIMHNYAALSMAALIVAYIINHCELKNKTVIITFILYLSACIFTDVHHFIYARKSGYLGKQLALEVIQKTGKPIDNVYCISIETEQPKYSSFCVQHIDAFAWGLSVKHYTGYKWPKNINDTIISENDTHAIPKMIDSLFNHNYQCIWIVDHQNTNVIKK